jgi:hypothetical protein
MGDICFGLFSGQAYLLNVIVAEKYSRMVNFPKVNPNTK